MQAQVEQDAAIAELTTTLTEVRTVHMAEACHMDAVASVVVW